MLIFSLLYTIAILSNVFKILILCLGQIWDKSTMLVSTICIDKQVADTLNNQHSDEII